MTHGSNPTLLERISAASGDAWIASVTGKADVLGPVDPYFRPTRKLMNKHSDEELAELIAAKPDTREAEIARNIMRGRENWRAPAKWALVISGLSLAVAAAALIRTL